MEFSWMNKVSRAVLIGYHQATPCNNLGAAFFHSTSLRERGQRNHGGSGAHCSRRSGFAQLLRSCQYDTADWFTQDHKNGHRVPRRKGIWISPENMEKILRSEFGVSRCSHEDSKKEHPTGSTSENYNNYQRNWGNFNDSSSSFSNNQNKKHGSSKESNISKSDWMILDRLTLGLSAYGPLRVEDVKNAYRACALKWHPDRHQGSSKGVAEEKFKLCSSAYQSLCDKLGVGIDQ